MTYKTVLCQICKDEISSGGAAWTSHMRMHVRKKEAVEKRSQGTLIFFKPDSQEEFSITKSTSPVTYETKACEFCGQQTSTGGAAHTSHMRMHVRKGELAEYKRNGKLLFLKADTNITDVEPYALLGNEPLQGQPKDVWQLPEIKDELPAIDPSSYFITSGEAFKKTDKLVKDLYALSIKARNLRDKLKKARGAKKYLELSHTDDKRLLAKAKDPRVKYIEDDKDGKKD